VKDRRLKKIVVEFLVVNKKLNAHECNYFCPEIGVGCDTKKGYKKRLKNLIKEMETKIDL